MSHLVPPFGWPIQPLSWWHLAGITPPQAFDDTYAFPPNSITVKPPGVLLNDKVDPGCPMSELRVRLISPPKSGIATVQSDGGFEYTVSSSSTWHA